MRAGVDPPGKGWFEIQGQQVGDRTLSMQMRGPDAILGEARGRKVLDLGCAEGLIGLEFAKAGAEVVDGIEVVAGRAERAREFFRGRQAQFFVQDLNEFASRPPLGLLPSYDIVLALSIAHKLVAPDAFLAAAARRCSYLMAVRLPDPVIRDRRSGFREIDVQALMRGEGFETLTAGRQHAMKEWCGIFRRV